MDFLFLSGCMDGNDSPSVSAQDGCGSSAAAIPAATSLSPTRRLMWPADLLTAVAAPSFSFMKTSLRPVVDANAVSDAAGEPGGNFLDQPRVAIGITEGEERPVARALGVRAGKTCLRRERCAMPHLTRIDATALKFLMSRFDVRDNQSRHGRAGRSRRYSLAERDRAP